MFVAIRLALFAAVALAIPLHAAHAATVGLHLASVHMPARHFNNTNPGLYVRSDDGWTVGAYRNSLRRDTVYAGYTWEHGPLGLTVGAMTGYQESLQAMAVPTLRLFKVDGVSARLAFIPRVEKRIKSNVLHLTIEYCGC